jgi:hypothetical protein
MAQFKGYARSRGFQRIPVRDKTKRLKQQADANLRDAESARQSMLQNANQHLEDLRRKNEIEKRVRETNESIRREYAQSYIDAYKRNADAELKAQEYASKQQQQLLKGLASFSSTLSDVVEKQAEKRRKDQLNVANTFALKFGLTATQFYQLTTLEGVLNETERQQAPVYQELIKRGASAEDLNTIINSSGYTRYAYGVASMQSAGQQFAQYVNQNADVKLKGFSQTLNGAELQGSTQHADILEQLRNNYVTENLAGFDPAFIGKYAKESIDLETNRRLDAAARRRNRIQTQIYDESQQQTFINLAKGERGAAAVLQRLQDLTGPDKREFKNVLATAGPNLVKLLESGQLPDYFVTDLANQELMIGNQAQKFGSLHSNFIQRLRIADAEGKETERRGIQAEYALQRTLTEETVRNIEAEMSEKARNGQLSFGDVLATITEMSKAPEFTKSDISKIKEFLPKTPDGLVAKKTIEQWELAEARDTQLPSIAEISASALLPDQKLEWYAKINKKIDAGLDDDKFIQRRDEYLKGILLRQLEVDALTEDAWLKTHPSVKSLFYRLQSDYDDLYSSDLTENINTRHEQTQAVIGARVQGENATYAFDGIERDNPFSGKVRGLSLPDSPTGFSTSSVDAILSNGKENQIYTKQVVPVSIIDNYLDDVNSGKTTEMPEAFKYIGRKMGVSPQLILEAQIDVANQSDKGNREVKLPESAEEFYDFVKGEPANALSIYTNSRYKSPERASRALINAGGSDIYQKTTQPLVLGAQLLAENGITNKEEMITFLAIKLAESAGDPNAPGDYQLEDGTIVPKGTPGATPKSFGWYQIHMSDANKYGGIGAARRRQFTELFQLGRAFRDEDLYNPYLNTKAAIQVYKDAGNSFTPWSAFKNGSYKNYLETATRVVEQWESEQNQTPWNRPSNMTKEALEAINGKN